MPTAIIMDLCGWVETVLVGGAPLNGMTAQPGIMKTGIKVILCTFMNHISQKQKLSVANEKSFTDLQLPSNSLLDV